MSDCIPFEIQKEIIKKVSNVKSLIRLRSVSKLWKSFIDSSKFVKGYGVRNTQPRSCSILSYTGCYYPCNVKYLCFVDNDDNNNETLEVVPSLVVSPQIKQYSITNVVGESHGLLCLYGSFSFKLMLVIWNPSIGRSFGIAVSNFNSVFGFGVCLVTRDPTVVRVTYSRKLCLVEVFTLSSGVWNVIPSGNFPRQSIKLNKSTHVAIDRFIYWGAFERTYADDGTSAPNHMLVSFDMITKEFRVVDLPNHLTNELYGGFPVSVCKLRESLVVYGCIMVEEALCCGVWAREHDSSFRKLFTIGTHVVKILRFRKSGEPIFEARKDHRQPNTLDIYDPCSQRIKNLVYGAQGSFFMGSYKESLLLLDQSHLQIYPENN